MGWDDFSCGLPGGTPSGPPVEGSDHCYESAFASKTLHLPTFVFESNVQSLTMTTDTGPLKFRVTGTYRATYA